MLERLHKSNAGFTLIEMLVSLAIVAVIGSGIFTALFQIRNVSNIDNAHMDAVKQVENAVHYLGRDIQQAQNVEVDGEELILTWKTWDNVSHQIIYNRDDITGNLVRNDGTSSTIIATNISSYSATAPDLAALPPEKHCTIQITCDKTRNQAQASESRVLRVIPRPGS